MKPTPPGWPRISPSIYCSDPRAAIAWLCKAFGFKVRMIVDGPDGSVMHSELEFGDDGVLMVSGSSAPGGPPDGAWRKSPSAAGGANTQNLFCYVDDVEAHCTQARAAGAVILKEPTTVDYGEGHWVDRGYQARDPEGHHWYFAERILTRG